MIDTVTEVEGRDESSLLALRHTYVAGIVVVLPWLQALHHPHSLHQERFQFCQLQWSEVCDLRDTWSAGGRLSFRCERLTWR